MKQQHKKLYTIVYDEGERTIARLSGLPGEGTPYQFLAGRYFAYSLVAEKLIYNREYQRLANLCQERIESGPHMHPHALVKDWCQRFPMPYQAHSIGEHKAYPEILALLKEYVGIEPTNKRQAA